MTLQVARWSHGTSGRSKRSQVVTHGVFVLEHVATGRFYAQASATVSKTVDKQLFQLQQKQHPCKLLNGLYHHDQEIRVHEYSIEDEREQKALLKELKKEASPAYLFLGK